MCSWGDPTTSDVHSTKLRTSTTGYVLRIQPTCSMLSFERFPPSHAQRPIFYGWPRPATRTVRWVAAQALHEVEHHLDDIERIIRP